MKEKLLIVRSRTVAMQQLLDAVGYGYTQFVHGVVAVERCAKLIARFSEYYQVDAGRNARARRKRTKFGNARLVMLLRDRQIYWWLLVTPERMGEHAAHSLEKLQDAMSKKRIQLDGFELVRLPRNAQPKSTARKFKQATRLTWRMSETKYADWRHSIIDSVRTEPAMRLHQLTFALWSSPGFGGVRSQIGKLAALYRAEVKRSGRRDAPELPKRLHYVRRMKITGQTLAQLVASMDNGRNE